LTLLFIGETSKEEIPLLIKRLHEIKFSPFMLSIRSIEFFNRRVLYLACDINEEIMRIRKALQDSFPSYFPINGKPFIPHITIKRWQRYEYDRLKKIIEANPFQQKSIIIDHLALFKGEKDSENRKYHVIERFYSTPTKSSTSTIFKAR
jgi:2'-5' RNA ligase